MFFGTLVLCKLSNLSLHFLNLWFSASQTPSALSVTQKEVNQSRYAMSAKTTAGALNCGPGSNLINNGWVVDLEEYWVRDGQSANEAITTTGGQFSGGVFTAPRNGVYHISGYGRCEKQACDVTIKVNGSTNIAAFGTDLVKIAEDQANMVGGSTGYGWMSTGVSTIQRLTTGQTVAMYMESGQSTDCLYDTSFFYGHLNVFMIFSDTLG